MASIVLGAVGAYFGGTMGYAIGTAIGSYIDQANAPGIQIQGPRLNDLKVQSSRYGFLMPKVYGASRLAGNVIWSTDIIETSHEQSSGGKGGGPQTTTTTYTYSQSFAIALCEGTITGIGRIWANGKLIYNTTASATPADFAVSKKISTGIRVYTGSETQTPDSLIQAHVGVANTPAYRGTAYIVFENLQLADFGNRMPNMEFEVIENGTFAHPANELTSYIVAANPQSIVFDPVTNSVWSCPQPIGSISKTSVFTGSRTDYAYGDGGAFTQLAFDPATNSIWAPSIYSPSYIRRYSVFDGTYTDYSVPYSGAYGCCYDSFTQSIWLSCGGYYLVQIDPSTGSVLNTFYFVAYINSLAFDSVTNSIWATTNGGGVIGKFDLNTHIITTYPAASIQCLGLCFDSVTNSIWTANYNGSSVSKYDVATGTRTDYSAGAAFPWNVTFDSMSESIWISFASNTTVRKMNIHTGAITSIAGTGISGGGAFDSATGSVWVTQSTSNTVVRINIADWGLSSVAPTLSSVVSNICTRASLTSGQIDVTALTDTVDGYVVQRSTARVQIEQLMQAFYFDAVESDGKVKFVKRGGAAALTIAEDDLAAFLYGGTMPENLQIDRKQEMELPVEVNVQYMDEDAAYQVNSQRSQRLTTSSSNRVSINLAISMHATKAKQISDVLMYDIWTARTSFATANSWKYGYLEPTDVINVVKNGRTYNVRLIDEDASLGVFNRTAVLDDAAVYTQTANAAAPLAPTTSVAAAAVLNLMLMDIPLLRDQDDGVGFYAAACPYSGTWSGEQTFKSNDGGASWTQNGRAILNAGTIGLAASVLGNFTGGNIFDETNSVAVTLRNGTLSSSTELGVLNGANVLLLGNEIIQFKIASLTAANTYLLSGLLRGRQGTEWAMSTHAIGDRVVLLSSTTTYIFDSPSSEYNLQRKYRGVSLGGFLDDAIAINFTNTGVAQECYAPVQLGGGRNAINDVTLKWVRRTRIGGAWNDFSDVPLGEASEAYTVEIYSSSAYTTLKRTITGITSATTTYTAAQQTADGLTPGNPVYFIVYQVSATVGTGYGARGVV
ncbi:MAG TPA: phage tail protein [Candidatus Paceibacterota bacterium]